MNFVALVASQVLVGLVGLASTRFLTPSDKGLFTGVYLWSLVAQTVVGLSLPNAILYFGAKDGLVRPTRRVLLTFLALTFVTGAIVDVALVRRAAAPGALNLIVLFLPSAQFLFEVRTYSVLAQGGMFYGYRLVQAIGFAVLGLPALLLARSATVLAAALLSSYVVALAPLLWSRQGLASDRARLGFDRLIPWSVKAHAGFTLSLLATRLDLLFVTAFLASTAAGLYAAAAAFPNLLAYGGTALGLVLARRATSSGGFSAPRFVMLWATALFVSGCAVAALMIAVRAPLIVDLFGTPYAPAVGLLIPLAISLPFWALAAYEAQQLAAAGQPIHQTIGQGIAALALGFGSAYGVTHQSVQIVAWSNVAAYLGSSIWQSVALAQIGHRSIGHLINNALDSARSRILQWSDRPGLFAGLVVWFAVLLTDGPFSSLIAIPALAFLVIWAPRAREVTYRFAGLMLVASVGVPVVWAGVGLVQGNRPALIVDQAEHFALLSLYFPMRWAVAKMQQKIVFWLAPTMVLAAMSLALWLGHQYLHLSYGIPTPVLQTALAFNPTACYRPFAKGDVFLIATVLALWLAISSASRLPYLSLAGLVLVLGAEVVLETRGLWAATGAALFCAVYVRRPSFAWVRSAALAVVPAAIYGAIAFASPSGSCIQSRAAGVIGSSQDVSTQIHATESGALLTAFWAHPVLGSGLGATLSSSFVRAVDKPYLYELTFHQLLFQLGAVGTIVFLAPLAWGVVSGIRFSSRQQDFGPKSAGYLSAIGATSLLGLLLASATNPYLFSAPGLVMVVLSLALIEAAMDTTSRQIHATNEPTPDPMEADHGGSDPGQARLLTIIVNFNTGALMDRCVTSLVEWNSSTLEHDVVIWENGEERQLLHHEIGTAWQAGGATVWYLGGEGNLGYARGVDAGYRTWLERTGLRASLVHCCNPDTVAEPDALNLLLETMRSHRWGAIAPVVTFEDGASRPAAYPPLTPFLVVAHFLRLRWMRRFGKRLGPSTTPTTVPGAIDGAFVIFDGTAWEQIGGLDEHFGISADDHDVCNRLRKAGWEVGVEPAARVSHNGAAGRSEAPLLSRLDEIQGSIRYVGKYYPRSLGWVRWAIWALLLLGTEPLSRELAWWARRTPVTIDLASLDIEENYSRALRSQNHRSGTVLASRLQSEWWRRKRGLPSGGGPLEASPIGSAG